MRLFISASLLFLASVVHAGEISCFRSMEGGKSDEWSWKNCASKTADGEFQLKPEFKNKLLFRKNGLANMCFSDGSEGGCYWLNKTLKGKRVLTVEMSADEFSQGRARYVDRKKKLGYINEQLEIVIPAQYDVATEFSGKNTAFVCKDCDIPNPKGDDEHMPLSQIKGHWFVIDKAGKTLRDCGSNICSE